MRPGAAGKPRAQGGRGRLLRRLSAGTAEGGRRMSASALRVVGWFPGRRAAPPLAVSHHDAVILSARYGAGHWQAAAAVAEALQIIAPEQQPLLLDYMDLVNPALNRTIQSLYLASIRYFPVGYGWFYRTTATIPTDSTFQTVLNSLGREQLARLIEATTPRVLVSTFPTQAGVLSEMRRQGRCRVPSVTVITDNTVHSQWIHPHTDMYCVSCPEVAEALARRGVPPERIAVTGIPVRQAFSRPVDPAEVRRRRRWDPDLPVVLVMSGAFGALGGIGDACRALADMGRPLQLVVVCGRDRQLAQRLERHAAEMPLPMHVYGYVETIAEFMATAEMLITKAGGVTTAEAMAMGVPLVIFRPIPGQERANADHLRRHGAAVLARNTEELRAICDRLLADPGLRLAMRTAARTLGRPHAALDVARLALRLGGCPAPDLPAPSGAPA
jgi:processive 1,2-diacylglycerol beta-glucosyltransferase